MLTKGEYALLTAFVDAPQRPLSREHLMRASRVHEDVFDRSIDVQILRLRRKLELDSSAPQIIRTERAVGVCAAGRTALNNCGYRRGRSGVLAMYWGLALGFGLFALLLVIFTRGRLELERFQ